VRRTDLRGRHSLPVSIARLRAESERPYAQRAASPLYPWFEWPSSPIGGETAFRAVARLFARIWRDYSLRPRPFLPV